ncbi:uncharacterized protein K460DRAFT_100776 [Cucurbitaria berberidis CBS 394.84]|uniref:Ribonucleases P/MRP subunit Pop8-like domain-containing protein n=1 Tax=Cucurbitaria berberidis CBS 394.84 TaxID=1168544 RepID=A0A9P4GGS1_9PLEO|nr:uncharacterized protein K460DRAFT_100776 [Cucurbitaria berberidis CBS 394.84]KAF1844944.1 hypothetical protein K460DRAFT_100776 [Cucurbitaria berberidis CBS 394.84]
MAPTLLPRSPLAATLFTPTTAPTINTSTEEVNTAPPNATTAEEVAPETTPPSQPNKKKRKRKETHILHQCTFRKPTWSYFHLCLITPSTAATSPYPPTTSSRPTSPSPPTTTTTASTRAYPTPTANLDALTISTLLSQSLTSYLGTTGAAIPIDILQTRGRHVFVRVPRQDARAVRASLSGWIGSCEAGHVPDLQESGKVKVAWRVVGEAGVLGVLGGSGDGADLFG